jgi:hypothetical protein
MPHLEDDTRLRVVYIRARLISRKPFRQLIGVTAA